MRTIKFRAWDKKEKKMYYSVLHNISFDGVVMQYTGLKDKNGKEIYEGDLVKNNWREVGVIKFDEASFYADWEKNSDCDDLFELSMKDKIEVIGNICENPELLKIK